MFTLKNTLWAIFLFSFTSLYALPVIYEVTSPYIKGNMVIVNGDTYIALQLVPVGESPPDINYWVSLADEAKLHVISDFELAMLPSTDVAEMLKTKPNTAPDAKSTTGTSSTSKLMNLSALGFVGRRTSNQHMVGGFAITGSDQVKLFIKCNGPTLSALGVPGAISNPKLTIKTFPAADVVLSIENWNSSDPEWSEIADSYKPKSANDAAAFITVSPGLFTTEVEGVNGVTGVGQIEIYTYDELSKKEGVTSTNSTTSKLMNLSALGFVGSRVSNTHMVGGFAITGSDQVKLLIKCNGPTLSALGVPGAIANPKLTIKTFPDADVILSIENWNSSDSEWNEIADSYQPKSSLDVAAFITVNPGLFTTEVEGVNGGTGVGQIEIYTYDELSKK